MKTVLLDTNVVLDMLLDRAPFVEPAAQLFARVENRRLRAYLCATTVTTIHYLARKVLNAEQTRAEMQKLLRLFEVAPVNKTILTAALASDLPDFEDMVLYESARSVGVDGIVTRNKHDFPQTGIAIYAPMEFIAEFMQTTDAH